ncbi:hypothetical protein BDQ94DRAFT_164646 [Aspergillus welwitschiae]|uniref:Uncharacterized protein n=1 Tax=Aspergillus welwitschiae TaxID=1341132 RepID=A0A3F3PIS1_9EURO|nr:hypothetical protein BDQ94DRAFT_164646 [Aspergillus welwitschiae]RDH26246.1 hypothetical protein BDQ94DRAFT_164646 [Aspergillus welwitschiae]
MAALVPTTSRGLMSVPPHPFSSRVSGEYIASFDQPAPVPEFAADNPYSICDGTQAHANSLIPAKGADEDQTPAVESRPISRQDLDLPCPLSALIDGMQHIPVRDMHAWVHRPVERRRQEALQRDGRIPRPMN